MTDTESLLIGLVSISDRASAGVYEDKGIPGLNEWFGAALKTDWRMETRLIPDEHYRYASVPIPPDPRPNHTLVDIQHHCVWPLLSPMTFWRMTPRDRVTATNSVFLSADSAPYAFIFRYGWLACRLPC